MTRISFWALARVSQIIGVFDPIKSFQVWPEQQVNEKAAGIMSVAQHQMLLSHSANGACNRSLTQQLPVSRCTAMTHSRPRLCAPPCTVCHRGDHVVQMLEVPWVAHKRKIHLNPRMTAAATSAGATMCHSVMSQSTPGRRRCSVYPPTADRLLKNLYDVTACATA